MNKWIEDTQTYLKQQTNMAHIFFLRGINCWNKLSSGVHHPHSAFKIN